MVSTNGTVVNYYIPGPESYRIPLERIRVQVLFETRRFYGQDTFLTSNLFLPSETLSAPPAFDVFADAFAFPDPEALASGMSTSAMLLDALRDYFWFRMWRGGSCIEDCWKEARKVG